MVMAVFQIVSLYCWNFPVSVITVLALARRLQMSSSVTTWFRTINEPHIELHFYSSLRQKDFEQTNKNVFAESCQKLVANTLWEGNCIRWSTQLYYRALHFEQISVENVRCFCVGIRNKLDFSDFQPRLLFVSLTWSVEGYFGSLQKPFRKHYSMFAGR